MSTSQRGATPETQPGVPGSGRVWTVLSVLAGLYLIGFGGLVVMAGEADDSPGLGGLGLITAAIGATILIRLFWPRRRS